MSEQLFDEVEVGTAPNYFGRAGASEGVRRHREVHVQHDCHFGDYPLSVWYRKR